MATEKWIAGSGAGFTWTTAASSGTLASLASGNAILGDVSITNQTALDVFADVDLILASAAFVAPNYVGVYLYPLGSDGTSYGDGRFGTAATGPAGPNYFVGMIGLVAATQAQTGQLTGIRIPPGTFKFVLFNNGGVNWSSGVNTLKYRTYNLSIA